MSVLVDVDLSEWGKTGLRPFTAECVNPASVDLRWSGRYRKASASGWGDIETSDCLTLTRGDFLLLDTLEYIVMPDDCIGILALKSSMGRNGLEHLHAGYVDPGFHGTLTLEIENRAPWILTLAKEQRIVQLSLIRCTRIPQATYLVTGRYNGQNIPTAAR